MSCDLAIWCMSRYEGNKGKLNFNLKDYETKAEVLAAVDRIQYLGENTNTTGGLKVARLEVFDPIYQQRPDVDRIIVLITDGVPTYDSDKLDDEVAAVKRMGIRIVGLGVTNKVRSFTRLSVYIVVSRNNKLLMIRCNTVAFLKLFLKTVAAWF